MYCNPYPISEEQMALLQLSMTEGIGAITIRGLIEAMGSATATLKATAEELLTKAQVRTKLFRQLHDPKAKELALEELQVLRTRANYGDEVKIIFFGDEDYPSALAQCLDAPIVLYVRGNIPQTPMISIVGTRKCTPYAGEALRYIISGIAEHRPDITIVSGLAYGVDKLAHQIALDCGLKSLAVVAHGLYTIYPSMHRNLATQLVASSGGVLTEYPYNTRALPQRFIQRNRIVAGLSQATIVVESAKKGGALVTANIAFDYGRAVYTVPGRLFDKCSEGCNRLIAQQKASILTTTEYFLTEVGLLEEQRVQPSLPFEEHSEKVNPILRELNQAEELTLEDLSLRTGEHISTISSQLFDLELDGKILALPGGRYRRKHH